MQVGDLVRADCHLAHVGGKIGVVTYVQDVKHCVAAEVLFETEVVFIRLDNLELISETI